MGTQAAEAFAIYQGLLDDIVDSYKTKDFARFQQYIHVPHHFRTSTETFVIRDQKDLEALFFRYIEHCEQMQLTDYIRTCLEARFKSSDRIQGTHESRMLNGSTLVCPIFKATSILMRMNNRWMVCASDSRLPATSAQGLAMREALSNSTAKFDDSLTIPPRPLEPEQK